MKTPLFIARLIIMVVLLQPNVYGQIQVGVPASTTAPIFTLEVKHQNGTPAVITNTNGLAVAHVTGPTWVLYASATDNTLVFYRNGIKELVIDANGSVENVSDRVMKKNIEELNSGQLAKLMRVSPKRYQYKNQPDSSQQYGFVAQELNTIYPEIVNHRTDDDGKEFWTVSYMKLLPVMVKAMQEQQEILQKQQQQIELLQKQLNDGVKKNR